MYGPYAHGWMYGSGMPFGGLGMILVWAIPLVLLFLVGRFLLTRSRSDAGGVSEPRTPLDILKESYARGEIQREEFLRRRDDLVGK